MYFVIVLKNMVVSCEGGLLHIIKMDQFRQSVWVGVSLPKYQVGTEKSNQECRNTVLNQ